METGGRDAFSVMLEAVFVLTETLGDVIRLGAKAKQINVFVIKV